MLTSRLFCGILSAILLSSVEALSSTARFSNSSSTSTTTPSSLASACCFAVQDTVNEVYWNIYTTLTTYSIVNLTSITTFVTPYPTTTVSNIKTNIYTTNASFLFTNAIGRNPITLYSNAGGGPAQTSKALNGTQTITAGVTVASPAAFWVYSTLKIITVPQVTNSNGDYVCATVSQSTSIKTGNSFSRTSFPTSTQTQTRTVTETLYTSVGSGYISATGTTTRTETSCYTYYGYSVSTGPAFTSTEPGIYVFTVNSFAEAYFGGSAATKPTGTVLTLATPYIYLPARGSAGSNGSNPDSCNRSPGQENFGYPVQDAIDFAARQYPQIASCLPGGPSVLPVTSCTAVSPETEDAGGDLTSSTVITVQPSSTAVLTTAIPTPQPITEPTSASPGTTSPQSVPETSTPKSTPTSEPVSVPSSNVPETQSATSNPSTSAATSVNPPRPSESTAAPIVNTPQPGSTAPENTESQPATSALVTSVVSPTSPVTEPSTIVGPPVSVSSASTQAGKGASSAASVVPFQGQATTNAPVLISPGQTQASVVPISASTTGGVLGSIIASMVGGGQSPSASTTISGVPNVIISTATTIPLSQGAPFISGLTTVISGTTNVIVSLATTIPASQASQNLPGSKTVVSGTTNVVVGGSGTTSVPVNSLLPGLTGVTTVVPGSSGGASSTFVIITGPTTVPVVSPTGSSGSASSSTAGGTSAPLQVSPGTRSSNVKLWSMKMILFGIIFAFVV